MDTKKTRDAGSWAGYYRGMKIEKTSAGWEIRTGIALTIHPSFVGRFTAREQVEREYLHLHGTESTRKAARAWANRWLARDKAKKRWG